MKMTYKNIWVIGLGFLMSLHHADAQSVWDARHLAEVKTRLAEPAYQPAYEQLIRAAEADMKLTPVSVMLKDQTPPSGSKHDYMSLSRYYWPDPTQDDGLPYISRDGISNPELERLDRNRLSEMTHAVTQLSLAYYFSGQERYAAKATEMLRVWFIHKGTRMNPNLNYAQCVPGKYEGRCYGVIDGYSFIQMLDAVQLLRSSQAFTARDERELKSWFGRFLTWLTTNEQALEEGRQKNNHATAYDVQVAAYARFTGNMTLFMKVLREFPRKRILTQIEPDGRQPYELRRTLAFGYSQFNLGHIIDLMLMAKHAGVDFRPFASCEDRSFFKAADFLVPYLGQPVSSWPWKQIAEWDYKQQELAKDLYRIYTLDSTRTDYLRAYRRLPVARRDRFTLLYVRPDRVDNAMARAELQLGYALDRVKQARNTPEARAKGLVTPCTLTPEGALRLVGPKDWRSGFFAGTLWQLYAYNRQQAWREQAVSHTWPIEEAKWHKGTHDLGFMIYDSFGKAWQLTGEKSYRDVVVQAAKTLITRYNPKVGCIRSWDHNPDKWTFPVIIDNMMNLEMLFEATRLTGDSTYHHIAVSHANTTLAHHFRPDYSSFHVVDYDPQTGAVRSRITHQGYSDYSFWSRGQGWALYGYTLCYRYTHDPRYLDQAKGIARFILTLPNMPADGVPYWDMKDPGIPNVPRDASAAALIASALYELCGYADTERPSYRAAADKIVHSLIDHYQAPLGSHEGFLLLHSTGNLPAHSEIDVPLNYADYYYLEALGRKQALDMQ